MLDLWLIRHGQTEGNKSGKYIGVTDEPLCVEGIEFLKTLQYPEIDAVFVSPKKRCLQTAQILFPEHEAHVIPELAECDFGEFENKNYKELSGNQHYQQWIDSNGMLPFPGGESREAFRERCFDGFGKAVQQCINRKILRTGLVVHGGTIMNLMEEYCDEHRSFYEWHVKNGKGYHVVLDPEAWSQGDRRLILKYVYE